VDYQHWEFYVASQDLKLGGDWSGTGPHFELNYGVVPDVQLHVITPLAYDVPPAGAAHYGLGDIELGVKYRFIHETNGPAASRHFPTGGSAHRQRRGQPRQWPLAGISPGLDAKKPGHLDGLRRRRLWR
jgi:hypothetical protein